MAGPWSAPNGDRSLTSSDKTYCSKHGEKLDNCSGTCKMVTKREFLARLGRLDTGKTKLSSFK